MQLLWINLIALLLTVSAQSTAPAPSTPSLSSTASSATVVPSTAAYSYVGCYNETTGDFASGNARALSGGSMNASDTMTVQRCLKFCGKSPYAGLEYGRECWCSLNLNTLSQKLPDSRCDLGCSGNSSQVCGGSLTITMYNRIAGAESTASKLFAPYSLQSGPFAVISLTFCAIFVL